jgi:excisionase family DNA binding protein
MTANHSTNEPRPLWSVEEVAHLLSISQKTVHKLVREGKLPCVQVTARERRACLVLVRRT